MVDNYITVENDDGVSVMITMQDATKEQIIVAFQHERSRNTGYELGVEAGLVIAQRLAAAGAGKIVGPSDIS